jgi:hypothetical protein
VDGWGGLSQASFRRILLSGPVFCGLTAREAGLQVNAQNQVLVILFALSQPNIYAVAMLLILEEPGVPTRMNFLYGFGQCVRY